MKLFSLFNIVCLFIFPFAVAADVNMKSISFGELNVIPGHRVIYPQQGKKREKSFAFALKDHFYVLTDDYLNDTSSESELLQLSKDLKIISRIKFSLPSGVAPQDWFIDSNENLFVVSKNWCSVAGCRSKPKTFVTKISILNGNVLSSRNFNKSWETIIQNLDADNLMLVVGMDSKKSSRGKGKYYVLSKNNLSVKTRGNLNERPLAICKNSDYVLIGWSEVYIIDLNGNLISKIKTNKYGTPMGAFYCLKNNEIGVAYNTKIVIFNQKGEVIKESHNKIPTIRHTKEFIQTDDSDYAMWGWVSEATTDSVMLLNRDLSNYQVIDTPEGFDRWYGKISLSNNFISFSMGDRDSKKGLLVYNLDTRTYVLDTEAPFKIAGMNWIDKKTLLFSNSFIHGGFGVVTF